MLSRMSDELLDLDPQIDRLAKVHAEAGFPTYDRYFIRLPMRRVTLSEPGTYEEVPVETTVAWTDQHGDRNEEAVTVHAFEVTTFVRHRAELIQPTPAVDQCDPANGVHVEPHVGCILR